MNFLCVHHEVCYLCGYSGAYGHDCPNRPNMTIQYHVTSSRKPHVCPKCSGEGTVDGKPMPIGGTVSRCWPCNGSGIVWEP